MLKVQPGAREAAIATAKHLGWTSPELEVHGEVLEGYIGLVRRKIGERTRFVVAMPERAIFSDKLSYEASRVVESLPDVDPDQFTLAVQGLDGSVMTYAVMTTLEAPAI